MSFKIGNHTIGKDFPVYFIADIASNHNGDIVKATELVHACAESGVNAIKMQNFTAPTIVSDYGFKHLANVDTHQNNWQTSVFDSYDAASIPLDWTFQLKELSESLGMDYFTSPYSPELARAVAPHVSALKLGSGDITWHKQIELISSFNKPVIIATGASSMDEVRMVIEISKSNTDDIILMQCNTNYTANKKEDVQLTRDRFSNINLKVLESYSQIWPDIMLGLSDHTHGHLTVLAAVGLYDCVAIEKHFTLDSSQVGQDHSFSMMPKEWLKMVSKTKELKNELRFSDSFIQKFEKVKAISEDAEFLDLIIGDGIKQISKNEESTAIVQRRAIRASKTLIKGHHFTSDDLEYLRPCPKDALPPYKVQDVIGKVLQRDIVAGDYLTLKDLF